MTSVGVRFGTVLADVGYGLSAAFRQGLSGRGLTWAIGIPKHQKVYPHDVELIFASRWFCHAAIMGLACCECEADRSTIGSDNCVDFGGQAATGTSHAAIVLIPLFPVAAC